MRIVWCGVFLVFIFQKSVFPPLLLVGTCRLLPLDTRYLRRAALVSVEVLVDALGEDLARNLSVLVAGAGGLRFYDDAGWEMLQLDGGVCLVLQGKRVLGHQVYPGEGGRRGQQVM